MYREGGRQRCRARLASTIGKPRKCLVEEMSRWHRWHRICPINPSHVKRRGLGNVRMSSAVFLTISHSQRKKVSMMTPTAGSEVGPYSPQKSQLPSHLRDGHVARSSLDRKRARIPQYVQCQGQLFRCLPTSPVIPISPIFSPPFLAHTRRAARSCVTCQSLDHLSGSRNASRVACDLGVQRGGK